MRTKHKCDKSINPIISFITPVYNNTRYLRTCVESVIKQGDYDIEYIIIDDGSTDDTPQLCDQLALEDSRISVIHQTNQWIYASFNNGVKKAKGEYIYILNSDDTLINGSIKKMINIVQEINPDVILTRLNVFHCDDNQKPIGDNQNIHDIKYDDKFFPTAEAFRKEWKGLFNLDGFRNQANLYRRSLMIKYPFRTDWYAADTFMNLSIAREIQSVYVMRDVVYNHYIYEEGRVNASSKFYGYTVEMKRELNRQHKALLKDWGLLTRDDEEWFLNDNVSCIVSQIKCLNSNLTDGISLEEKLQLLLTGYVDDEFLMEIGCKREEIEARVLSCARKNFLKNKISKESEYYFLYDMLTSLLRYEKDDEDYRLIEAGVYHKLNPYHIGITFLKKISEKNTD